MTMVTRCPHCETVFRVAPEQLQARAGRVRCGHCARLFDGFKALTTLDAVQTTPAASVPAMDAAATFAATETPVIEPRAQDVAAEIIRDAAPAEWQPFAEAPAQSVATETTAVVAQSEQDAASIPEPAMERIEAPTPLEVPATAAAPATPDTMATAEIPAADEKLSEEVLYTHPADVYARLGAVDAPTAGAARRESFSTAATTVYPDRDDDEGQALLPRRIHRGWALAASLAALALVTQAVHAYRSEIAANYPALKPALVTLCNWARCSVPPLQRPTALKIEASDLQVVDPARPNIVQLTATLRNYSATEVGYPALDLVLTSDREHALARRVFLPADYLAVPDVANATIAANAEVIVRIDLDVGGLAAAGFRLNLSPAIII